MAVLASVGLLALGSLSLVEPVAPPNLPAAASVVDIHVHIAGLGTGCAECFVSDDLVGSYKFAWYLGAFGTSAAEMEARGDVIVIEHLLERMRASRWVKRAVVLALDGVIGADGEFDRPATQVYVPNEYVRNLARRHDEILFGASINPYRSDALARLDQVKREGAVLVKWIPAIMAIDPADAALDTFYARLVALRLPLLVHVGAENAFRGADDRLGDPLRLLRALEAGVTVIAAHLATTGKNGGEENFARLLPLFERYPNLYTDQSSLTQINKLGYLVRALAYPGVPSRLLHGSDWPLQFFPLVHPYWHIGRAPLAGLRYAATLENPFDRDIATKAAMGVPAAAFTRSGRVLGIDAGSDSK
ncbi:MAG: amidohydrolase family protein [Gammaproteobacteria bacterium]